jgi:hypothetical protein
MARLQQGPRQMVARQEVKRRHRHGYHSRRKESTVDFTEHWSSGVCRTGQGSKTTAAQELWDHKNGISLPFINVGATRMRQVEMLSLWSCDVWPNSSTSDRLCSFHLSAELLFLCLVGIV